MRISGPSTDLLRLLGPLSYQRLPELVADLLAVRRHSRIKIVDGPGDGGRDIHSIDVHGRRHLTQCKFHQDPSTAVSSRELGDLPLGMIKLGYKHGLFVTTGRISPQSKREFIDNFPGLRLQFLDGAELVAEVLRDVLLKAIWFNGVALEQISYAVSVPVLLRDLTADKPLPRRFLKAKKTLRKQHSQATTAHDELVIRLHPSQVSSAEFAPYRPPIRKTMSEGWWPSLSVGEILITGLKRADRIGNVLRMVSRAMLRKTAVAMGGDPHLAIRVGRPSLTPLQGRDAGSRIDIGGSPFTYILQSGAILPEGDWLLPTPTSSWSAPRNVGAITANWVRWYNPDNDLCLDLTLTDVPSDFARGTALEQIEHLKRRWHQSVFAFVPTDMAQRLEELGVPSPTEQLPWYEQKVLCCWFVGSPSNFRSLLIEPEEDLDPNPSPIDFLPEEVASATKEIREKLLALGCELVDSERARHAYALQSHDPFPTVDKITYRSVDLLYHFDDVPSPISPTSRHIQFIACWLFSEEKSELWLDQVQENVDTLNVEYRDLFRVELVYDTETTSGTYVILYIDSLLPTGSMRTDALLRESLNEVKVLVTDAETRFLHIHPSVRRATERFWNREIGLYFRRE